MEKTPLINPKLFDDKEYDEHKLKESAECLMEAEEIKKDPLLMQKIKEYLAKQEKKIKSLKDLKEVSNNFTGTDLQG
jgi:hypothetical protein